eukprot:RCo050663
MEPPAFSCRRAVPDDVLQIKRLIGDDYPSVHRRYGNFDLRQLIETSYFSIVATEGAGEDAPVVGFAVFADAPTLTPHFRSNDWVPFVRKAFPEPPRLGVGNTLWAVFAASQPMAEDAVYHTLLATLYTTLPETDYLLVAQPPDAAEFGLLQHFFQPLSPDLVAISEQEFDKAGAQFWLSTRQAVVPDLVIRKGRVEDYDDLMPLLLAEAGVLTELGEGFYLDELLERQDATHSVLVAEDGETGQIVGLMCMTSVPEDQQYVVKHFSCEPFQKLKRVLPAPGHSATPTGGTTAAAAAASLKNSFTITFFYLSPDFECRAVDFVRAGFREFPAAEYGVVRLPHSIPDHPLLATAQYVPLKQGLTLRLGCFLLCRYALEELTVRPAGPEDVQGIAHLLATPGGDTSKARAEEILEHVRASLGAKGGGARTMCLLHRDIVVGVLVGDPMSPDQTRAYSAAFDVDTKVDFLAASGAGDSYFKQTPIEIPKIGVGAPAAASSSGGSQSHAVQENVRACLEALKDPLPGLRVRGFFVRPIFRPHIRLFLRESLRQLRREMLYYTAGPDEEVCSSLVAELMLALPRGNTGLYSGAGAPASAAGDHGAAT